MEFVGFYEKAIRSIARGTDPESFARLFYDYFEIPIIIVDEAYKLLAYANGGHFEDPYWEDIVQCGAARTETITSHYLKAGYLESIANSEVAIYVDWGVSQDYPQSCGPVYVNKELEGFVSLLFMDAAKKEEACHLNTMICSLFSILLQTSGALEEATGVYQPASAKGAVKPEEKQPLDEIIEKINELYKGQFTEADRVLLTALQAKLMKDPKLATMARTSDPQIFAESIFPKAFGTAAQDSYMESQETYSSLFEDQSKYNAIMNALCSVVYREMRKK